MLYLPLSRALERRYHEDRLLAGWLRLPIGHSNHMKPPPFRYAAPITVRDATGMLAEAGGGGRVLAGGQSLIPMLRQRLVEPEVLVDLRRIDGMHDISFDGHRTLALGAMVTHRALDRWAADRGQELITDAAACIGHYPVRTMGTVVGSLAHADPAAEWSAVALVLNGVCHVAGPTERRLVGIDQLFSGPHSTSLANSELITMLTLELPGPRSGAALAEVAPRPGDPAVAGAAAVVTLDGPRVESARVALIGLAATPCRAPSVEIALMDSPAGSDMEAMAAAVENDIAPVGDIHGSEEYRRWVAPVVVARALRSALVRASAGRS